jgi:hypothetical protein
LRRGGDPHREGIGTRRTWSTTTSGISSSEQNRAIFWKRLRSSTCTNHASGMPVRSRVQATSSAVGVKNTCSTRAEVSFLNYGQAVRSIDVTRRALSEPPRARTCAPQRTATIQHHTVHRTVIESTRTVTHHLPVPPVDLLVAPFGLTRSAPHLATLGAYVRLGEQTSARVTADTDPAARCRTR